VSKIADLRREVKNIATLYQWASEIWARKEGKQIIVSHRVRPGASR
jgi:hypothetical protein